VTRHSDATAIRYFIYGEKDWRTADVVIPADQGVRIRAVPRPWLDAMLNKTPLPSDGHDGRIAVEMVLAAYEAAETGKRIQIK
jgi:predicted dehydrogenase